MDDLYDMKDNAAFRKQKADEYGFDFELPFAISIVSNVRRAREVEPRESCVDC
jgi:hypothetical protein